MCLYLRYKNSNRVILIQNHRIAFVIFLWKMIISTVVTLKSKVKLGMSILFVLVHFLYLVLSQVIKTVSNPYKMLCKLFT